MSDKLKSALTMLALVHGETVDDDAMVDAACKALRAALADADDTRRATIEECAGVVASMAAQSRENREKAFEDELRLLLIHDLSNRFELEARRLDEVEDAIRALADKPKREP